MGKKENPLLAYYDQDERFAELMNGWFFGGKPYWKAENISAADRRQDGRSRKHMERKDLAGGEFLSQFSKEDRLLPVITLVLYCGEAPWDGAGRLHELLELEHIPEGMKECVADYPIHILDICHTPDERLREFPSDICFMLLCIKYAKDKEAFSRLKELAGFAIVSEDTYETIAEYLGEPELLENREQAEKGGKDMCEAIRALVEDGRNEGLRQGIQLAKQVFRLADEGVDWGEIAKRLSISEKEVEQILN